MYSQHFAPGTWVVRNNKRYLVMASECDTTRLLLKPEHGGLLEWVERPNFPRVEILELKPSA